MIATQYGLMEPLISVVVPAYKPGPWLAESVASIGNQSAGPLEIIIVDDGNEPPLLAVDAGDASVAILRHANEGVSAARNRGAAVAKGAFLVFLDADDLWLPSSAERLLAGFDGRADCGVVHGLTQRFRAEAPGAPREVFGPVHRACNTGTLLFRREAFARVGGFDTRFRFSEDFDLLLRIKQAGIVRREIDDLVMLYRRGHGSTTERAGTGSDFHAGMRNVAQVLLAKLARQRAGGTE